jgi:hypothetical protein
MEAMLAYLYRLCVLQIYQIVIVAMVTDLGLLQNAQ